MPLTFAEIEAWCRLTGVQPKGWEVKAIRSLSGVYCSAQSKAREKPKGK